MGYTANRAMAAVRTEKVDVGTEPTLHHRFLGDFSPAHSQTKPVLPRKGGTGYLTSSLSCTWMKRGRAKPTWASSGMATLYSELLNSGALSLTSMTRMLKVVVTLALEGVRSSFSSVPCKERKQQSLYFSERINVKESVHGAWCGERLLQLFLPPLCHGSVPSWLCHCPINTQRCWPSSPITHALVP